MVKPGIDKVRWGRAGGRDVELYTLVNDRGSFARIASYGATVTELHVPDRGGRLGDVVLGYDGLGDYMHGRYYFGCIVGRVGNRIAGARFELDGERHALAANDGAHHLHGGDRGWDKVVWDAEPEVTPGGPALRLAYVSRDGEEGYPGTVTAAVTYTLGHDDELRVEMVATADRTTPVNMAHHSYWNLRGSAGGDSDVLDHLLTVHADRYTPGMPPAGEDIAVAGTPFDFTRPKPVGRDLAAAGSPRPGAPAGYDLNLVVSGDPHALRPVAALHDPVSGRTMTLASDQPGVQLYSGLFLDGTSTGKGRVHGRYAGLCLETQRFPNAINVPAWRDSVLLRPGETYRHVMIHTFVPPP
jgi:aldose 1-epimerase